MTKIDVGGRSGESSSYTYVDSKVERYTYTPDGPLDTKQDRNGNITRYEYDVHGRLVNKGIVPSSGDAASLAFSYDNNGNRLSMKDTTGTSRYTFDERNRNIATIMYKDPTGHWSEKDTTLSSDQQAAILLLTQ